MTGAVGVFFASLAFSVSRHRTKGARCLPAHSDLFSLSPSNMLCAPHSLLWLLEVCALSQALDIAACGVQLQGWGAMNSGSREVEGRRNYV